MDLGGFSLPGRPRSCSSHKAGLAGGAPSVQGLSELLPAGILQEHKDQRPVFSRGDWLGRALRPSCEDTMGAEG